MRGELNSPGPDPDGRGEVVLEETRKYIAGRQIIRSTRHYRIGAQQDAALTGFELRCFFPRVDLILQITVSD